MKIIQLIAFILISWCSRAFSNDLEEEINKDLKLTIEGKVYAPELFTSDNNWQRDTIVNVYNNDEHYQGFLKQDGSFIISSVSSGSSYVVEIYNPDYVYEPVRVEINPKGKFRARKVNYVQPSQVLQVPYPLKLKALTRFRYFQQREQWKITDFLFNPMILMMLLPVLLLLLIPKIMSDPETKKEMEQLNLLKPNEMPEISEVITSFFSPKAPKQPAVAPQKQTKQTKKRN